MTICSQKVTKQVKIRGFSTTKIENSDLAILTRYENFPHKNWYHKATVPISTVLFTLCPMSWRIVMELIQNWDNQNQQAKGFQMRYNLSKLNYQNYKTLTEWSRHVYTLPGIFYYRSSMLIIGLPTHIPQSVVIYRWIEQDLACSITIFSRQLKFFDCLKYTVVEFNIFHYFISLW